jgi:hypothetical protein
MSHRFDVRPTAHRFNNPMPSPSSPNYCPDCGESLRAGSAEPIDDVGAHLIRCAICGFRGVVDRIPARVTLSPLDIATLEEIERQS